jgi:hypothetical protein
MLRKQNKNKILRETRKDRWTMPANGGHNVDIARLLVQLRSDRRRLDRAIDALETIALERKKRREKPPVPGGQGVAKSNRAATNKTRVVNGIDNVAQNRTARIISMKISPPEKEDRLQATPATLISLRQ